MGISHRYSPMWHIGIHVTQRVMCHTLKLMGIHQSEVLVWYKDFIGLSHRSSQVMQRSSEYRSPELIHRRSWVLYITRQFPSDRQKFIGVTCRISSVIHKKFMGISHRSSLVTHRSSLPQWSSCVTLTSFGATIGMHNPDTFLFISLSGWVFFCFGEWLVSF